MSPAEAIAASWRGFKHRTWPQGISDSSQAAVRRSGEQELTVHLVKGLEALCAPGRPEPTKDDLAALMARAVNEARAEEGREAAERKAIEQGVRLARFASRLGAAR